MPRPFVHPAAADITVEGVLHALADPARLAIVACLSARGCGVNCSTAAPPEMAKSTLSYHYRLLREAGVIRSERQGTAVVSTLRRDDLDARFPGLLAAVLKAAVPKA